MFRLSYRGIALFALAVSLSVSVAAGGGMGEKWIAPVNGSDIYWTPEPYNTLGLYDMNGTGVNEMIVHKQVMDKAGDADSIYVYNPITGQIEWSILIDSTWVPGVYPFSCFIDIDNDGSKEFLTWSNANALFIIHSVLNNCE